MHRLLFLSLRLLSAWPILVVLVVAIGVMHWTASGIKMQENEVNALLQETLQIKQERNRMEAELNGLALTDLRRRSLEYAEDFLSTGGDAEASIRAEVQSAFELATWDLSSVVVEDLIEASSDLPIGAVSAALSAKMRIDPKKTEETLKLPVLKAVGLGQFIWRTPPYKEIHSIRLERTIEGYEMSMGIFLPCRHETTVADTTTEERMDGELIQ